ncbi:isoquinoline 1-oxidoreductase beta subunit [Povalibacter uvarum]|uniref:Isoquinoline 1-oxidoreductase beta subunit n=1 Tax=Povalibacter uvarum TaxID=732238 RepID=A0A841HFF2_9GAMM|nr:molybdopterin cofactor-binding domain-containing protein [Povalibacter uvarum]MBB6091496.1 isoquinoline 1-oxidoreductase beta subunit [Povalibacter uvarum]
MGKWTRRAVITAGSLVGGGLALGVGGIAFAPNRIGILSKGDGKEAAQLTTWLKIAPDNMVTAIVPHCEMGQGVHTALTMMLAEELDADWNLVRMEEAPAEEIYANGYIARAFVPGLSDVPKFTERFVDWGTYRLTRLMDLQVTGGSSSVRGTGFLGMRVAGGAARTMLIEAAAKRWNVPVGECETKLSSVIHPGSSRSATYGELAADAAKLDPPVHPQLKSADKYTIVGKPIPRIDIPSKVDGSAKYGIDVAIPGMLYATVAAAPVFGAQLGSVDATPIANLPGVKKVVKLDNAVAVVADSYWRALKALRTLIPTFTETTQRKENSETLASTIGRALEGDESKKIFSSGDAAATIGGAAKAIEAEYRVPFLAHATMEPMNATARIANDRCEVWTGVQDPLAARKVAADASGLDADQVTLYNQQLGGGFGRRLPGAHDFVDQAVRIAKEMSPAPVKLIWSREEDIQHDYYRPAVIGRYKGAVDSKAAPIVWISKFNGAGGEAAHVPYAIAHQDIRAVKFGSHVRQGSWRSVEHSQHGFFTESFIDELAHAAGKEPYEFRRGLLEHAPRHRAVLEKAAWISGWGAAPAAGRARGIALVESFGSIVAEVAEVEIVDGRIKVHNVWAAVDCGYVVNPDTATAQIEGGIIFGLSAAVFNEITIQDGRVAQSNFNDFPLPKIADAPRIKVEFIQSNAALGGLGEPGVPPIAPAVANAVFALTGKRVRSLPLKV